MRNTLSRRDFARAGAIAAVAPAAAPGDVFALTQQHVPAADSPIRFGVASYTFRNFTRAQMIAFLKQLNVLALNAKDVKDHLPTDPQQQAVAVADYAAADVKLHAAGTIYFPKDEDADIRGKFEYSKPAEIPVLVAV